MDEDMSELEFIQPTSIENDINVLLLSDAYNSGKVVIVHQYKDPFDTKTSKEIMGYVSDMTKDGVAILSFMINEQSESAIPYKRSVKFMEIQSVEVDKGFEPKHARIIKGKLENLKHVLSTVPADLLVEGEGTSIIEMFGCKFNSTIVADVQLITMDEYDEIVTQIDEEERLNELIELGELEESNINE